MSRHPDVRNLRRMIGLTAALCRFSCRSVAIVIGGRAGRPSFRPRPGWSGAVPLRASCCDPGCAQASLLPVGRDFAARLRSWRPRSPPPRPARFVAHGLRRGLGSGLAALQGQPLPLGLFARRAVCSACGRTRLLDLFPAGLLGALLEPVARLAQPFVLFLGRRQRRADRRARREAERAEHQRLLVQRVEEPAPHPPTIVAGAIAGIARALPQLLARLADPVAGARTQTTGPVAYAPGARACTLAPLPCGLTRAFAPPRALPGILAQLGAVTTLAIRLRADRPRRRTLARLERELDSINQTSPVPTRATGTGLSRTMVPRLRRKSLPLLLRM